MNHIWSNWHVVAEDGELNPLFVTRKFVPNSNVDITFVDLEHYEPIEDEL